jgi:hypothetical protein
LKPLEKIEFATPDARMIESNPLDRRGRRRGVWPAWAVAAQPSKRVARHGFLAIHPAAIRNLEFEAGDSKV